MHLYPGLWKSVHTVDNNNGGNGIPNGSITMSLSDSKIPNYILLLQKQLWVLWHKGLFCPWTCECTSVPVRRYGHIVTVVTAKRLPIAKKPTEETPQTITIDYILAERSREYFGEGQRWWDLSAHKSGQTMLEHNWYVVKYRWSYVEDIYVQ